MKSEEEKIDSLLDQNADEQLSGFDWERLSAAISNRLDAVETGKVGLGRGGWFVKAAAGFVAAAAIVLVVVMVSTQGERELQIAPGSRAAVRLVENTGQAKVEIAKRYSDVELGGKRGTAVVSFGKRPRIAVVCKVEIIDSNGDLKKKKDKATWSIIYVVQAVTAENGVDSDEIDVMCLL